MALSSATLLNARSLKTILVNAHLVKDLQLGPRNIVPRCDRVLPTTWEAAGAFLAWRWNGSYTKSFSKGLLVVKEMMWTLKPEVCLKGPQLENFDMSGLSLP